MDLGLKNQTAIVFGAGGVIGRSIAEAFLGAGCRVGGFDRAPSVESLPNIYGVRGEASSETDVKSAVEAFIAKFGEIHHVVHTVGIGSGKFGFPFWNLSPADWPKVLDVNLVSAVNVATAVAPHLTSLRRGSLLFTVSVAAQIGSQTDPPYSAAKAGLVNFMQCAAKDFAPYDVRVNAISPGMVQTPLNESVWAAGQAKLPQEQRSSYEEWGGDKIRKISPLGRWQEPAEFGSMAVFLASNHARNITGQTLNIDGGQVMHS
jgi:2-hydroxycyclohexanecarboxyl-CoA dehydrogenase